MNIRSVTRHKQGTGSSRLVRPLIELGEYAKREGLTSADVKKCSEIGIVQLRSHRGKTFVVDIPVCSYDHTEQIDNEVAELLGLIRKSNQVKTEKITAQAEKPKIVQRTPKLFSLVKTIASKVQQALRKTRTQKPSGRQDSQQTKNPAPPPAVRFEPGAISQLVQEMLRRAEEIKTQDQQAAAEHKVAEIIEKPQKQSCQATEELLSTMHRRLDEIEHRSTKYRNIRVQAFKGKRPRTF